MEDVTSLHTRDPYVLRAMLEEREEVILDFQTQLLAAEQMRRGMHNQIQELRGNIRVYVRVRPFLPTLDDYHPPHGVSSNTTTTTTKENISNIREHPLSRELSTSDAPDVAVSTAALSSPAPIMETTKEKEEIGKCTNDESNNAVALLEKSPIQISTDDGNDNTISISSQSRSIHLLKDTTTTTTTTNSTNTTMETTIKSNTYDFNFNRVFGPSSTQDQTFDEVTDFVQSAMDGYNVCLFSYGQTGSGKTHTMQGYGTGSMRGIIPRSVEQILIQANNNNNNNSSIRDVTKNPSNTHNNAHSLKNKKDLGGEHGSFTAKNNSTWEYEIHASLLEI